MNQRSRDFDRSEDGSPSDHPSACITSSAATSAGTLRFADSGEGPTLVFLHGVLMDGSVWDPVVELLRPHFRCVVPTLPLGAHRVPARSDADLSLAGFGRMVNDFLEAADLHEVTLVGNDHAAILAAAVERSDRVARLVITSCEAFENYPPGWAGRNLRFLALVPGGLLLIAGLLRFQPFRQSPLGFGWLSKATLPAEVVDSWLAPLQSGPEVRRDLRRYASGARRRDMEDICRRLGEVTVPSVVVWTPEDRIQRPGHGARLAAALPDAALVLIQDSFTLIMRDQPARLADLIGRFVEGKPLDGYVGHLPTNPGAQERRLTKTLGRLQRVMAGVATGASLGLAIAHFTVSGTRRGPNAGLWELLGPVLTPSVMALLLALAAGSATRWPAGGRATRVGLVVGAVVMPLLAGVMIVASVATGELLILRPDGPGLWSLLGSPAFILAAALRPRPPSAKQGDATPAGGAAATSGVRPVS